MKKFLVESICEETVVAAIASAKWRVRFYAPGLSVAVAKALIEKAEAFRVAKAQKGFRLSFNRSPDFLVAVEVTPRAILDGWGDADAIRKLWVYDVEQHTSEAERWFYVTKSLRIGILIVDDETLLFAPLQKAVGGGWNGMRTTYELMLKEVEADFLSSPIAERLVSAADIEALVNAELLTREALEGRVHEMEAVIKEKEEVIAKKDEEIKEKEEVIAKKDEELKEAEARAKEAERKLNDAVGEAEKKYKFPPVTEIEFLASGLSLERMDFKIPSSFLMESFPNNNADKINASLKFSEKDLDDISNMPIPSTEDSGESLCYKDLKERIEKLRKKFVYSVSYQGEDFVTKNPKAMKKSVLIVLEREELQKEIKSLKDDVSQLKDEIIEKIRQVLVDKLKRNFPTKDGGDSVYQNCVNGLELERRVNPHVDAKEDMIPPEVYNTESFKKGLKKALLKRCQDATIPKDENRALGLLEQCDRNIDKLYKLCTAIYPQPEEKSEEFNKKDEE